ncbi:MAG: FtsX-like permease family protein, partial [Clostridiales bacterium]|nr:FtsX-like permease family protein [Clostridiales bacterium]
MRKGFFLRLAISGIRKNRSIYYPYILTAVLTTAMMYIIGSLQNATTDYSGTLAFSLQLGIVVTSIFSVVFLFYTNSFLMRRRKKEFGLYNILGMEKRHLARLLLWETALMLGVSLVLGLAVGMLLDKLMHLVLSRLVGQAASLTFAVSFGSIRYTAILISITFTMILINSVRQVYFARPVELLRSAEVGEREPKARWFITLVGLLALGAGYWLSATVKDAAVMILFFFIAVLLVIVGTYLLFTSGSVTLLKALRKNRRYYYKPDHFISVSGMIYRMKQNAVGLANVCILSTMVLVMVFSTLSLWLGMEDTL